MGDRYTKPDPIYNTEPITTHPDDPAAPLTESNEDTPQYDTGHIPGSGKTDKREQFPILAERPKRSRLFLWAVVILVGGLLLSGVLNWFDTSDIGQSASGANEPVPGQLAPNFSLKTLDGSQITLSDLRGQPVLINFWASWCGPCRREMPELIRVYANYRDKGFIVLALNLTHQDTLPAVAAFVEEFRIPFPVLLDEAGEVTKLYQLRGIPVSVFVDRTGVVRRVYTGAMTGEQLDQFVAEIL